MRRGRKPFKAEEHIASFNKFRMSQKDVLMSNEQLREGLKRCGILCNKMFCADLRRFNIIKKIGDGYIFINSDKPIHFKVLDNVYLQYCSRIEGYTKACIGRKAFNKNDKDESIRAAIKLLRGHGYEVFIPIGKNYTKM